MTLSSPSSKSWSMPNFSGSTCIYVFFFFFFLVVVDGKKEIFQVQQQMESIDACNFMRGYNGASTASPSWLGLEHSHVCVNIYVYILRHRKLMVSGLFAETTFGLEGQIQPTSLEKSREISAIYMFAVCVVSHTYISRMSQLKIWQQ